MNKWNKQPICDAIERREQTRTRQDTDRVDAWRDRLRLLDVPERTRRLIELFVHANWKLPGTQRELAERLQVSVGTVNTALRDLRSAHLIEKVDGDWLLDADRLSAICDVAEQRKGDDRPPPEVALDRLMRPPSRSAAFSPVQPCSTEFNRIQGAPVSVTRNQSPPVESIASRITDSTDCLKHDEAWRRLQTEHFRDTRTGQRKLDRTALGACFYAAVQAGLCQDTLEHKENFWACAFDLANDGDCRSPAVRLRRRVEMGSFFRTSDAAKEFAKRAFAPLRVSGCGSLVEVRRP